MSITVYNSKGKVVGNFCRYSEFNFKVLPKGIYIIVVLHSNGEKERHLINISQ